MHIVLDHFDYETQYLLNDFMSNRLSWFDLLEIYHEVKGNANSLSGLGKILNFAKANPH